MPFALPSAYRPAALNQPPVPYPALPFQRPQMPMPAMSAMPKPQQSYSWTMPWSQMPGTMGFPGDMAAYAKRFQDSSSTMDGAAQYGNQAAYNMHLARNAWDNKPLGAKRKAMGLPKLSEVRNGMIGGAGGIGGGGSFQQSLDQANQANEARYRDILGGFQSRYDRNLAMLAGLGQQEGKDINELYDQQFARGQQDLIGRGLGNSTRLVTLRQGVDRERANDLGRLNERMRQQVLNTDQNLSGDVLNFMERKTEQGPDMRMLAQLAQGVGAAGFGLPSGYGGGFGGGGNIGSPNLGTAWINTGGFPAGAIDGGNMSGFGNPMASMPDSMFRGAWGNFGFPGQGFMPQQGYYANPNYNSAMQNWFGPGNQAGSTLNGPQQQQRLTAAQRLANTPNSRYGFGAYGRPMPSGGAPAGSRAYYNFPNQNNAAMQAQAQRAMQARNAPSYVSATAPPGFDLYNPLTWSY